MRANRLLILTLLLACQPKVRVPTYQLDPTAQQTLRDKIRHDESGRHAMSAEGPITLWRKGFPLRGRITVAAQEGGKVRLDLETPEGSVIFAFASDGRDFSALDLEHKRFMQGPLGPQALSILGLEAIDAYALSQLLLANSPCPGSSHYWGEMRFRYDDCLGGRLLADWQQQQNAVVLSELSLEADGQKKPVFGAKLSEHTPAGLPKQIDLKTPNGDLSARFEDVELNPEMDPSLFQLSAPPGVRVEGP